MTPEIETEAARLQAAGVNQIDAYHQARANEQMRQIRELREAARRNTQALVEEKING